MSQEKQKFIAQAFAWRAAVTEDREQAFKEAQADWTFLAKKRMVTSRVALGDKDIQLRILEALARGALATQPNGPRLRELLSNRIREKHGAAPGTARLQQALNDLKETGCVWMSPERRVLRITAEGETFLKSGDLK